MNLLHVTDDTGPDHLGGGADGFVGVALVAHLGGHFVLGGGIAEEAGFPYGAGEGLLDVDMFTALHGVEGDGGVHVIGDTDGDGVDVLALFVEHDAEVFVLGLFGELLEVGSGAVVVDIAEGDDVFGSRGVVENDAALAAAADGGDVQLVVEGLVAKRAERGHTAKAGGGHCPGEDGSEEEVAAIHVARYVIKRVDNVR